MAKSFFYKKIASNPLIYKAFFENHLDVDLKEGKLNEWNIGKNASYSDIESLLKAVDWDYIKFIFNRSWSDACDEFRMSYIEKMI